MIENIIFDFGGVIFDIDHNLSKQAFQELGLKNFDQIYGHLVQTTVFEQIEKGEISEPEFRTAIRNILPHSVSDDQIDDAWCALIVGFDKNKIDLIENLGKNYRIFLLSNSNIIHYKRFIKILNAYKDFRGLFTDVWFSHEKGQRKPDIDFYSNLLKTHQMEAKNCLFIDDLWVNISAAQSIGIQTHFLDNGQNILDLFENNRWKGDL